MELLHTYLIRYLLKLLNLVYFSFSSSGGESVRGKIHLTTPDEDTRDILLSVQHEVMVSAKLFQVVSSLVKGFNKT